MVPARLVAGLSGLRNRNARVTNKTILRVIRGNIDSVLLDDDEDEKNKVIASQGVDEEDANVSRVCRPLWWLVASVACVHWLSEFEFTSADC